MAHDGMIVRCTVAIPTFNRDDMIRGTLESVLDQEFSDLEILVVDDQSTDRVFEIAASYSDPRLRVTRNEKNLGLFGNFNRCLELARGQFVRILCNDDRLTRNCIKREVEFMEADPTLSLLVSQGRRVSRTGVPLGIVGDHFPAGVYDGRAAVNGILWFFAHYGINPVTLPSGVLMRRSACLQAGGFDESMRMDGDIEYFLRILEWGNLRAVDEIGCEISVHNEQVSSNLDGDVRIFQENFTLVNRHRESLKKTGTLDRITEQFSALALCLAVQLMAKGRLAEARAHRDLALRSCSNHIRLLPAAIRCLGFRTMLRYFGLRRLPTELVPSG
jgi:glycosyltransferase involved in cell wall biosynthesis